ncbi:type I-C CRISPR-associated protein Cas8c/Csd1 [Photobacterium sp. GB-50]|uniref:type I-C CRISPR-associated protein Cas8c/Csd1 n=1 Tax=Photobacterium sp. GB-50 TaxID=2022107 RepID=UPI000D162E0E|nr:type I-C CRISPR-associated protein Cas8c/Csd1 [Photobacterium sp. GB-50]PSW75490.1 type I-C CRISPR-associated protein Cas8c/Csd1 [Photobacterium sp. GB-50]
MSWLGKLYKTYEAVQQLDLVQSEQIMPICHTPQNAHIHITLNQNGEFIRAEVLEKTQIVLPATEKSASRSSGEAPHPLADKLQYVAKDYANYGGKKKPYFNGYEAQLKEWIESPHSHPKAAAVYLYISKGTIIADLIKQGICHVDENQILLTSWDDSDKPTPLLLKVLPKEKGQVEQGSALVCWSVEIAGDQCPQTWKDSSLQQAWIDFDINNSGKSSLCYVTGNNIAAAVNHPAKIRHTGDKAKLISSNDKDGYTYRGRFFDSQQAATVSFEVTQKAHNTLRWLIDRQGYRNGDQVIIAWAVNQPDIPQPLESLDEPEALFNDDWGDVDNLTLNTEPAPTPIELTLDHSKDLGQRFGHLFSEKLKGKFSGAPLALTDSIVVMALDSATPGRMGVTYYRDFQPAEYLSNLEAWHLDCAWWQRASKEKQEAGTPKWYRNAPSQTAIIDAVYGDMANTKSGQGLKKNISERLLPSIIDKQSIPLDIMRRATYRATQRHSFELEQWEQNLGVACALYRGYAIRTLWRNYAMALETNNTSRDYLYGRLLAVAENIEQFSLDKSGEKRLTNAGRLMQRFADRPFTTWKTIELSLLPYIQRLQNTHGGFITARKQLLDQIHSLFNSDSFNSDKALSAEFLLGFHSQRLELMAKKTATESQEEVIN